MDERVSARNIEQVFMDGFWPGAGLCPDPEQSTRHMALAEVLCTIPDEDYEILKSKTEEDEFQYFIPHYDVLGLAMPFTPNIYPEEDEKGLQLAPYSQVIYLSPRLELMSFDIVVAVVAHELAHITLGHKLRCGPEEYELQEAQAWDKVRMWGFKKEVSKHSA